MATVVWHRADLRAPDNPAVAAAGDDAVPLFVVDAAFFDGGLACDARLEFLLESLADLDDAYRERGGELVLAGGDPVDVLTAVADSLDADVHYNHHTTARYGRERDRAVAEALGDRAVGHVADAIRRDAEDPRDGWSAHAEAYMEAEPFDAPDAVADRTTVRDRLADAALPADVDVGLSVDDVRDRYDVDPEKTGVQRGGRTAAVRRLEHFVDNLDSYPGSISSPTAAERHCSRLSPYLALGCLSVREAYQRARASPHGRGRELFTERLYWNQHFRQKLQDWPRATERAINPVMRGLHRDRHDPELVAAWQRGETGFPLVDAAMRCLVDTGHLNFRMRALVATFFCHVLQEWWKRGADFMYYHLLDADAGINYEQWQMQGNLTGVHPVRVYDPAKNQREHDPDAGINYEQWQMQGNLTGVHPVRVYDPAKNQREHDPDGAFVREHVPELEGVPDGYLAEPWRMSRAEQRECGVEIGTDYPRPVVDFERRASDTRERFGRLADRAREALEDPEIRRRASLSRRHETVEDDPDERGQASLGDF